MAKTRKRHPLPEPRVSWAGIFLLAALMLGGGTRTALTSDFLLMMLGLPMVWRFIMTFPRGLTWQAAVLILAIPLLFIWQLMPLPGEQGWVFPHTLDPGKTLNAFMITLLVTAFFHNLLISDEKVRESLIYWLFAGVVLNLLLSIIQFASPSFVTTFQPFSWSMNAGFFANANHLAALFALATPFIVVIFHRSAYSFLSIPVILMLIAFQFLVGSRAGIIMTTVIAIAAYLLVASRGLWGYMVLALGGAIAGFLAWRFFPDIISSFGLQGNYNRKIFALNTLAAIRDFWPWGSGLDTFTLVYPKYESATGIYRAYVNHAHNDWLELVLEGGIIAIALTGLYIVLLGWSVVRAGRLNSMQKAALLGILFLMVHSLVDYPLRTLALSLLFAWLNALIFAKPEKRKKGRMRVRHKAGDDFRHSPAPLAGRRPPPGMSGSLSFPPHET